MIYKFSFWSLHTIIKKQAWYKHTNVLLLFSNVTLPWRHWCHLHKSLINIQTIVDMVLFEMDFSSHLPYQALPSMGYCSEKSMALPSMGYCSEKSMALLMDIALRNPWLCWWILLWEIHGFADGYCLRNPWLCWWILSEKSMALLMDIVWEIHGFADGYCLRNPWFCWWILSEKSILKKQINDSKYVSLPGMTEIRMNN